jgi:hypothetical protein
MIKNNSYLPELILFSLFFLVIYLHFDWHSSGDDMAVIEGLKVALDCLETKPLGEICGYGVKQFPILLYLIALPFNLMGFDNSSISEMFSLFSFISSILSCLIFYRIGYISGGRGVAIITVGFVLSGYLFWYMFSSFSEALGFFLFSLFILAIVQKWKILYVGIIAFFCTITKDIAFPFIVVFLILTIFSTNNSYKSIRDLLRITFTHINDYKIVYLGIIFGICVNSLFNFFKYGTITNAFYTSPIYQVPIEFAIKNFYMILFSPAHGLIYVWFSFFCLIITSIFFFLKDSKAMTTLVCLLLILVAMTYGFSFWFSPFGMVAWGPRLNLPLLAPICLLVIIFYGKFLSNYLKKLKPIHSFLIIFTPLALSSLPNLASKLNIMNYLSLVFQPLKTITESGIEPFIIETTSVDNLYYKATIEGASRNIIFPSTEVTLNQNYLALFLWLLFFTCLVIMSIYRNK